MSNKIIGSTPTKILAMSASGSPKMDAQEPEKQNDADVVDSSAQEYFVEKILDKRIFAGGLQYLVKWIGYENPSDLTWEAVQNLTCDQQIREYEKLLKLLKQGENEDGELEVLSDSGTGSKKQPSQTSELVVDDKAAKKPGERPRRSSAIKKSPAVVKTARVSKRQSSSAVKTTPVSKRQSSAKAAAGSSKKLASGKKTKAKEPELFEVEEVVGKRVSKGATEYKIQWKGYELQTWEPEANLHCGNLINEYEQMATQKKRESKKRKSAKAESPVASASGGSSPASLHSTINGRDSETESKNKVPKKRGRSTNIARGSGAPDLKRKRGSFGSGKNESPESVHQQDVTNVSANDGPTITSISYVSRAESKDDSIIARVIYSDASEKFVPTGVLATKAPKLLIQYYEKYLHLSV